MVKMFLPNLSILLNVPRFITTRTGLVRYRGINKEYCSTDNWGEICPSARKVDGGGIRCMLYKGDCPNRERIKPSSS
jgi:hypothetical protein